MSIANKYEAGNMEAARIVLESPDKYAGGLLDWAKLFMATHPAPRKPETLPDSVKPQSVVKMTHPQANLFTEAA